ncbi:LOW QUALITY PROTEIN: spermatogenesis associated 6-like protein [Sarcoramphus papa]
MPLKVVVELQVHAVTGPGVFLPEKHDIFLCVCILGQHKETECLLPVFPLLFHEMCFEKVFESAVDPAAVTEILQINYLSVGVFLFSVGDDLAFYEGNTRHLLFPEHKLTPAYPGVDRELLIKTSPHFPGIAPKIEVSTRTTITELPLQYRRKNYGDSSKSLGEVTSPLPHHKVKQSVRSARDSLKFHAKGGTSNLLLSLKYFFFLLASSFETVKRQIPQLRVNSSLDLSWEKINERVRNLLTSAQAKQRLASGASKKETDDVLERRSTSLRLFLYDDSKE